MTFNHDELVKIEREVERAVRTVRNYADRPTWEVLDNALYIFAEVRHAGLFLCDPATTPEARQEVLERLANLFKEN